MTIATDNDAAIYWQSRLTTPGRIANFPRIINVESFARQLASMGHGRERPTSSRRPAASPVETSSTDN